VDLRLYLLSRCRDGCHLADLPSEFHCNKSNSLIVREDENQSIQRNERSCIVSMFVRLSVELRNMRRRAIFVPVFAIFFLLSGCVLPVLPIEAPVADRAATPVLPDDGTPVRPDEPVASTDPTPATPPRALTPMSAKVAGAQAPVEDLQLFIMESFPVQVTAQVSGYLADGCTRIVDVTVEQEDQTFVISIFTTRPVDQMCTMALVPYQERVELPVQGLEAGEYTVIAGGVTATFTLDVDNVLLEEE
jgi:hypothetical protein